MADKTPFWARVPKKQPQESDDQVIQDAKKLRQQGASQPVFPDHLQHREVPPRQLSPKLQKRQGEIQEYYDQAPEEQIGREPAPKKKGGKLKMVFSLIFIITMALGAAASVMNFMYARGSANMATSVSFLHLELCAIFVAMIFGFVVLDWR